MAYKLIDAAQARWRAVNAPHLVALVRAGAVFHKGKLLERQRRSPETPQSTGIDNSSVDERGKQLAQHVGWQVVSRSANTAGRSILWAVVIASIPLLEKLWTVSRRITR
ncbi:hypothetical protein [Mycobacterium bouchedurhonense]|uniref:hypothetical protein n=1 Tax=Mycobacterium bouchedurhonense TaxID=701041 RepID=UPI003FD81F65